MSYLVLRNCYINDKYFAKGQAVKLPEDFPKSPKNFKLMKHQDEPVKENLTCPKCGKECKSQLGFRSHLRVHIDD